MLEPKDRLRLAREKAGFKSPTDAAARLPGLNRNTLTSNENGNREISRKMAKIYGEAFGVDPGWILYGDGERPADIISAPALIPGSELVGDRDFPIYTGTMGGDGHLIISLDVVEMRKRPSILEGVKAGYGLLVFGDSMWPAYRHGDTALVHPGLPFQRDEVHIFYDHPPFGGAGETEAIIKNLTGWTDRTWHVEQFNPPKKYDLDRVDWPTIHQVVGKHNGRR